MTKLGFVSPQKFATRRRVVEQVAHFEGCATGVRGGCHSNGHIAAITLGLLALCRPLRGVGGQRQARHRRNGRERLATKSQSAYGFEVFNTADLAGGSWTL